MTVSDLPPRPRYPHNRARDISDAEPYRRRIRDLVREGESHRRHWAEIEEYEFPRRGRWLRGDDAHVFESRVYSDRLLNNTPLSCRRTVASGLQNGLTPSSRDWCEIHPEDESLRDDAEITWYLSRLKKRGLQLLSETNFYSEIFGIYEDTPAFSMSALLMEDDDETLLHFQRLPIGSFWPECDARNRVNGLLRRYAMTSEAMLQEFGRDVLPARVKERLEDGRFYDREEIYQFIRPRDPEDGDAPAWAQYECVYLLETRDTSEDRILARRYYRVQPFAVFRWAADDGSAYGSRCPGMDALGDCRELQSLERKKLRALDVSIDPPLAAPSGLRGYLNRRPGTVTWTDGDQTVKPLMNVQYDIRSVSADIALVEQRIKRSHYEDVFLALLGTTKQMTAEEARQRSEERTMVLGPIIERFCYDLLPQIWTRLIDAIMFNRLAPPPPEALQGNVKFTFSGPLALIQKAAKLEDIAKWVRLIGEVAATTQRPEGLDRIDADEIAETAARGLDLDEALLAPAAEAKKARAAQQQAAQRAQQQAAAMQGMEAMTGMARDMSQAQVGGGNMLEAVAGMAGGGA